jgi:hypothetical protein
MRDYRPVKVLVNYSGYICLPPADRRKEQEIPALFRIHYSNGIPGNCEIL